MLEGAGCTHPAGDAVDLRIIKIKEVREHRGISDAVQVGGWPNRTRAKHTDGDSYTNLEEFLNDMLRETR